MSESVKLDYCPMCDKRIALTINEEKRSIVVQDQELEVNDKFHRCPFCKEEWYIEGFDFFHTAYDIYKEKNNMITTEQVLSMSESQLEKAEDLGISYKLLEYYKKGCLQTKEHDDILRSVIAGVSLETLNSIDNSIHNTKLGIVSKSFDLREFKPRRKYECNKS